MSFPRWLSSQLEPLEKRAYFAGFASLNATGTLSVVGTSNSNQIKVSLVGPNVVAARDGETLSFAKSDVKRLWLAGFAGNDTIRNQTSLPATLVGGAGDDSLDGGGGADVFDLSVADSNQTTGDTINGRGGKDLLDYSQSAIHDFAFNGNVIERTLPRSIMSTDSIVAGESQYTFLATSAADAVIVNTWNFAFTWNSGAGNDLIACGELPFETARFFAGPGNDVVLYNQEGIPKLLDLGSGHDEIRDSFGGNARPIVDAGSGSDSWFVSPDDDNRDGVTRNYVLPAGLENFSAVYGTNSFITVSGNELNNRVFVAASRLSLKGGSGNDVLVGIATDTAARSTLNGQAGDDVLFPGGQPVMFPGYSGTTGQPVNGVAGVYQLIGGAGRDTADYSSFDVDLNLSLDNKPNDGRTGDHDNLGVDIETILGGSGNDTIIGSPFANALFGGNGNDTIWGGNGNDTLNGGAGNDSLFGQGGNNLVVQ